jgi:putative membrane protein
VSLFTITLGATLVGTLTGGICSLMPSLHIYNVAGIALLLWTFLGDKMPFAAIGPFFISMIVAFSFLNAIPMTYFGAPDESATVTILPGTKYLMNGKGHEAVMLSGIGGLCGVALLAALTPFFFYIFPYMHSIMSVHMHWILGLVMVYMLMSEWPKGCGLGHSVWERLTTAWANLFAGIITFGLSAILGLIITSKSIITHEMGFQNIMPVFVGLFAIPSIIQSLLSEQKVPKQHVGTTVELARGELGKSTFAGGLGGMLAAYLPAVTAGIGGILAGHATASRGDRIFIIGGGVAKVIYYVGAFLFLFVLTPLSPFGLGKGGLNIILKPVFSPEVGDYALMLSVIIVSGCLSFLVLLKASGWVARIMPKVDLHRLYWGALVMILAIVGGLTGGAGLFVLAVASCIGTIPVFYHCRRSNCMAVLLVPICLNMAGYGDTITQLLGLI